MSENNRSKQEPTYSEEVGVDESTETGVRVKQSHLGVQLIRTLASEGDRIFTTARAREFCPRIGMSESYLPEALYHLVRNEWIIPLRRGLYAISSELPGMTPVHEFEIAMHLVSPVGFSHWSAMQYHGMTEQIPAQVFVLTTNEANVPRLRGRRSGGQSSGYPIGDTTYRFVQVKPERFFGMEKVWISSNARVTVTDPERTLIDGLTMPQYCGGFTEVLNAFSRRGDDIDVDRIVEYALRLDKSTARRLGWVLEHAGIRDESLKKLLSVKVGRFQFLMRTIIVHRTLSPVRYCKTRIQNSFLL